MSQCGPCPWRDLDALRNGSDIERRAVEHAEAGHLDGFVCHTRFIPCPGPRLALRPRAASTS